MRKLCRRHGQTFGKVLDKGATACRTGFIQRDIADIAVFDKEALHILTANIEHKGDFRTEFLCRPQMRKSLDLAAVGMESRLDDGFTVTGSHGAGNISAFRQGFIEFLHFAYHRGKGRALIAAVGRIENFLITPHSRYLCSGGTGINAHIDRPLITCQIPAFYLVLIMTGLKGFILRIIGKQGKIRLPRFTGGSIFRLCNAFFQLCYIDFLRFFGKRCPHGHKVIAVIHVYHMVIIQF